MSDIPGDRTAASQPDSGAATPPQPDPQRDRHMAFPGEAAPSVVQGRTLPSSAWAPRPAPPTSDALSTLRHPAPAPHVTPAGRRGRSWVRVVIAIILVKIGLGVFASGSVVINGGDPFPASGPGIEVPVDHGSVVVSSGSSVRPFMPDGQRTAPVPSSATIYQVEVVTASGSADVEISSGTGVFHADPGADMPYTARVDLAGQPGSVQVTATTTVPDEKVQCRIYVGSLVAIETGTGTVSCSATAGAP